MDHRCCSLRQFCLPRSGLHLHQVNDFTIGAGCLDSPLPLALIINGAIQNDFVIEDVDLHLREPQLLPEFCHQRIGVGNYPHPVIGNSFLLPNLQRGCPHIDAVDQHLLSVDNHHISNGWIGYRDPLWFEDRKQQRLTPRYDE